MALCAVNTRNTRVLLLSPLLAMLALCCLILAFLINPEWLSLQEVITNLFTSSIMEFMPFLFTLYFSWRMDILETVVAQANLRKVSDYLHHAPKGWMIGQKTALNFGLLAQTAGLLSLAVAFCTFYVQSHQQSLAVPWEQQEKYEHFGTCADGIRSGLEQHIDCGRPESSCAHTCREKYGEYILISPDRECTDVDGYVHITTQRACAAAHRTWARLNNRSGPIRHAVVHEGAHVEAHEKTWFELGNLMSWQHADWTGGFRCGAYTRPRMNWGLDNLPRFSFPALSSKSLKAKAYLCYAKRTRSCQAKADTSHFEEMMSCAAPVQHKWPNSAWRNISGPLPTITTTWSQGNEVAEFGASRGRDGDCARIRIINPYQFIGAQVVFTLACNDNVGVDPSVHLKPANASAGVGHGIACPKDNISKISIECGKDIKSTFLVSSTAKMTNMTAYRLGFEPQNVVTYPGSVFVLVVDRTSDLRRFTLCF